MIVHRKIRPVVWKSGRLALMRDWHLYLIRTRTGTLYTGISTDVPRLLAQHRIAGRDGAKYLRARAPLELVYRAKLGSRSIALKAEYRLKRLPKQKKERIVATRPRGRRLLALLGIQR